MLKLCSIVVLAAVVSSSSALQSYLPYGIGTCEDIKGISDFDPERYFGGVWYEQRSYGNYLLQADGTCSASESEIKDGKIVSMFRHWSPLFFKKWVYLVGKTNSETEIDKSAGTFDVVFDLLFGITNLRVPFTVLATDYDNWAVIASCKSKLYLKSEMSWVVTRKRGDNTHDEAIKAAVAAAGLDYDKYIIQDHENCGDIEEVSL